MDEVKGIEGGDGLWARIDRIVGPFFPPKSRKYISFSWMTVFVLCIFGANFALKRLIAIPADRSRLLASERIFHQPIFLVPYDIGLSVVLFLIFVSKPNPEYEYLRALIFGMVLAAILGQILILFVPW